MEKRVKIEKKQLEALWQSFDAQKLKQYIAEGKTVFVDVTAEWCLTCKVNKLLLLERSDMIALFKERGTVLIRADYTNRSPEITKFLRSKNASGIPLNIVYGKNAKGGIVLSTLPSKAEVINSLDKAS